MQVPPSRKRVFSAHPYPEDWQPPVMRSNRELKQGRFLPAFVNRKWTFSITGQFFFFFLLTFLCTNLFKNNDT